MADDYIISNEKGNTYTGYAWMRKLVVIFTSDMLQQSMAFGDCHENTTGESKDVEDLVVKVEAYKYMSTLKDSCTIDIVNLTYSEITQLITGKFWKVEVKCGYGKNLQTVFKGGVLYISNNLSVRRSNVVTAICASELIAQYNLKKLKMSFKSGMNLYSIISFLSKRTGISNIHLSPALKTRFTQEIYTVDNTLADYVNALTNVEPSLVVNSDAINGAKINIYDAYRSEGQYWKLTSDNILLTNGYPRINSTGLSITVLPTLAFSPGDVIEIDNSIIDLGVLSLNEAQKKNGTFIDENGCYVIYEIEYQLENHGANFSTKLLCKPKSLLNLIRGGLD